MFASQSPLSGTHLQSRSGRDFAVIDWIRSFAVLNTHRTGNLLRVDPHAWVSLDIHREWRISPDPTIPLSAPTCFVPAEQIVNTYSPAGSDVNLWITDRKVTPLCKSNPAPGAAPLRGYWVAPLRGYWAAPLRGYWVAPLRGYWLAPLRGSWATPLRDSWATPLCGY